MDPELLRLLIDMWRARQTSGDASIGGLPAYDDYNISSRIGEPDGVPATPVFLNGVPIGWPGEVPGDQYDMASTYATTDIGGTRTLSQLLAQMQQGVGNGPAYPQMSGLFGSTPVIERPKPQTVTPVAAPVAGQLNAAASGTPTPDPRSDVKTLPNQNDASKPKRQSKPLPSRPNEKSVRRPIYSAPQAAQQIAQRAIASMQPQQQRTFTSAPAGTAQAHALPISRPNSSLGAALAKLKR